MVAKVVKMNEANIGRNQSSGTTIRSPECAFWFFTIIWNLNIASSHTLARVGVKRRILFYIPDNTRAVQTRRWFIELKTELKTRGFATLAVINPHMHPTEEVQTVLDPFDGEIQFYEENSQKLLRIKKMYCHKYLENELLLKKDRLTNIGTPIIEVSELLARMCTQIVEFPGKLNFLNIWNVVLWESLMRVLLHMVLRSSPNWRVTKHKLSERLLREWRNLRSSWKRMIHQLSCWPLPTV